MTRTGNQMNAWLVNTVVAAFVAGMGLMPATAADGPVVYWSFNEARGVRLHDVVGSAHGLFQNDGELTPIEAAESGPRLVDSGAGRNPAANYGSAVRFEPDDSVFLGRPLVFELGRRDFTITGWFAVPEVNSDEYREIFSFDRHNQGGYAVLVCRQQHSDRGKLILTIKGPGDGDIALVSDERVDDGQWHWFAGVVKDGRVTLHVDGVRQGDPVSYTADTTATPPSFVQAYMARKLGGSLDDLAIFDRALSDAELQDAWNRGLSAFGYPPDQPATKAVDRAAEITVTEHVVFDGHEGWEHDGTTYRLAVGVVLAQAPNGDLLLAWTTGADKEPADDNCAVLSRSTDGGRTWTEPRLLVPSREGMQGVITNMYRTRDNKMVIYGAHLPPQMKYTQWHYFCMVSEDSGHTWSDPEPFLLRGGHGSLGQGEIPLTLPDGRALYVGHWYRKRERPLVAPAAELAHATTLEQAEAMPEGEGRKAGSFASHLQGIQAYAAPHDHSTRFEPLGFVFDRPLGLIEPTTIRLSDGTIAVLMRADWGGYLWRTDSHDNGRTWSKAYQTEIPNPSSMVDLVRLADGRIALIHNPVGGKVGERARRDPLAVWVSDDEMKTWSIKANVIAGGALAYPDSIVLDSGKLVFGYDRDRRQVRFVEVHVPPATD